MPIARFQMPDGRVARFEVPEGTTPEQAQAMVQKQVSQPKPRSLARDIGDATTNALAGLAQGASAIADIPFQIGEAATTGLNKLVDKGLRAAGAEGVANNLNQGRAKFEPYRFSTIANQIERLAPTKPGFGASRMVAQVAGGLMAPGPKLATPPAGFADLAKASQATGKQTKAAKIVQNAIIKRLAGDGVSPQKAGQMMDDAAARGVPLSLMDVGDNTRALGGYLSRTSGTAKTIMRNALKSRQAGAPERIRSAISRDLGEIANPYEVSDNLMDQARRAAAPLYEEAYKQPIISTPKLRSLMDRPAMRAAVGKAFRIAQEEGRNPSSLGFSLDDAGNVVMSPMRTLADDGSIVANPATEVAPSMQTMDYVKRGLDDVLEPYRNKLTGRLDLDTEGRAINQTAREYLSELDAINPTYAAARKAYAGPASANTALLKGRGALSASADDIERMAKNFGAGEREQFALGFRAALADAIDKSGGSTDIVNKLLGTARKRKALAQVFGGEEGLANFLRTMEDEAAAFESYRTLLGSPTAGRVADDFAGTGDLASNPLVAAAGNAALGRPRMALGNLIEAAKGRIEFGANKTADEARNQAAALLSEVNPNAIREIMAEAARQNALRIARQNALSRASVIPAAVSSRFDNSR